MEKIIRKSFLLASMAFLYTDPSLSTVACNYSGAFDAVKAAACVNDAISSTSSVDELFRMSKRALHYHVGDVSECAQKRAPNTKSYFPSTKNGFREVFAGATVSGNCTYNRAKSNYNCWVKPQADVCYIPGGGFGKKGRTPILFVVSASDITTLYPSPRRSESE